MNQKIKISQLPAKGSNLAAQDLLEVAEFTGTGYVSKSITGQELIDAIPAPTGFVPESRTLTINGTTQDLSADRTFTISTPTPTLAQVTTAGNSTTNGITIGNVISNGTIRVTATTASPSGNASFFVFDGAEGTNFAYDYGTATYRALAYNGSLVRFLTGGTERARFAITTGNFLINTTTDAGFRLDVNGTARFNGNVRLSTGSITIEAGSLSWGNSRGLLTFTSLDAYIDAAQTGGSLIFRTNGSTDRGRIFSTGNWGINTTTDAGFRLDVNGTARVSGNNMGGVFTVLNANNSVSISMASLLAASATGDTFFTVGRSLTNNNSALIGHSTVGGGNYAFLTVYGRPANDLCVNSNGQVGLGTNTPNASARLQIDTTTQGFLPPRMTTTQRNAIASPAAGLMVYDTTLNVISYYNGTMWI